MLQTIHELPDFNKIAFPTLPALPLATVLPSASPEALDLLSKLLVGVGGCFAALRRPVTAHRCRCRSQVYDPSDRIAAKDVRPAPPRLCAHVSGALRTHLHCCACIVAGRL